MAFGQIWRPNMPDSIDGQALCVSISDLHLTFPYERLPLNKAANILMRPCAPFLIVVMFLASEPILKALTNSFGITGKSTAFRIGVALHNLALAIFSFTVMVNVWSIVVLDVSKRGMEATFYDQDGSLWASGFGAWATIFYFSKYYEFADTYLLILKGKDPSLLQVYHHAGIVLVMWGGVASHGSWIMIVVLLNSAIHSLMYTYFLVKTIWPAKQIPAARFLTSAQIGQFCLGLGLGQFMGFTFESQASYVVSVCLRIYALGLIALFSSFFAKRYKTV